ncbi:adenine deaminase [Desulfovibrio aminophilus]|uniref:adenine deaminase n=1 Tax=Desulfovibrio aminophilus TaxID=81425 RepID=UPI0033920A2B
MIRARTPEELARRIRLARGREPVDLLLRDARLVNVLSGEIHPADIAVADGLVVGFGAYEARAVLDLGGRHVIPGLIDGHLHIESSLLCPREFARAVAPHGTAAVVCDPHEIANVLGAAGIEYMLAATADSPLGFYFMMPSCVPATRLETSGAELSAEDVLRFLEAHPGRVLGLAEMMNFPGLLGEDPEVLAKLLAAGDRPIDGHAPLLQGHDLAAYVLAGPGSDHECTNAAEALEKLRLGMRLMIREGTSENNLDDLLPALNECNAANAMLVSDDLLAPDILARGHMDHKLRHAVAAGVPPVRAVQMASINPARHFGLPGLGAVAPGFRADMVVLDDLERFQVAEVFLGGRRVRDLDFPRGKGATLPSSMRLPDVTPELFALPSGRGRVRVIGVIPGQILTEARLLEPTVALGRPAADPGRDLAKLAVIERHRGSGNVGLGLVQGLGLRAGALASSVGHDSHNLIVAGADDADMALAAREAARLGGGFVAALNGRVRASLPLPLAGLMSAKPLEETAVRFQQLLGSLSPAMGEFPGNPFGLLSFLALPVIPALKLTDRGLVDVNSFDFIPLWTGKE